MRPIKCWSCFLELSVCQRSQNHGASLTPMTEHSTSLSAHGHFRPQSTITLPASDDSFCTSAPSAATTAVDLQASSLSEAKRTAPVTEVDDKLANRKIEIVPVKEALPPAPQLGKELTRYLFRASRSALRTSNGLNKLSSDEFLTTYRRLFAIIFFTNVVVLVWLCLGPGKVTSVPKTTSVAIAVPVNIMTSSLHR